MQRVSLVLAAVGRAAAFARPSRPTRQFTTEADGLPHCLLRHDGRRRRFTVRKLAEPITAKFITGSSVGLRLAEGRRQRPVLAGIAAAGGRPQRCRAVRPDDPQASERGGIDVTPKENNVRTRVHEYGGGAFQFHKGGGILFSDFKTQRLHLALGDGQATVITDKAPDGQYRYADYDVSEDGGSVVCVREDHGPDGKAKPVDVVNEVVAINLATGAETVLAQAATSTRRRSYRRTVRRSRTLPGTTRTCRGTRRYDSASSMNLNLPGWSSVFMRIAVGPEAHAPRERVAVVSRRCRSHTGACASQIKKMQRPILTN